jgi:TonB-dependent receptor
VVYSVDDQGRATWFGFSNEAAVRTFADLSENAIEGNANWQLALGRMGSGALLRVGGLYRSVDRDAVNTAYSISLNRPLPDNADAGTPEEIFDGRFSGENDTFFRVTPLAAGGSYTASDRLAAGYAMVSLPLSSSIDIIAGARFESSRVEVASLSTAGEPSLATPEFNDLLPSLAVTWRMRPDMNLRASATQTLSRPEYRELSPILFREVIGYDNVRGNADLQRALIRNFDLRWEFYPSRGEILSVGVFAKDFDNPIERVYQGTSGTRIITYTNALGASNYGVELEARKALGIIGLETVTAFANATVMQSQIELDPNAGSVTNSERKMVGQSPYVLNGGITWSHPTSDASATVLFNRVGERIVDAGELPLPDVVEKPRNVLDVSFRLPVFSTLSARVDAKNLLDAPYQITQGSVIRERYTAGRILSVGFSWRQ